MPAKSTFVETFMVVLMSLLIFLESAFEVMQTDLPTSTDPCCFCNNSFSICENIFPASVGIDTFCRKISGSLLH